MTGHTTPVSASRGPWTRMRNFACALLVSFCAAQQACGEELRIGGTGSALGSLRLVGAAFSKRHPDVQVTVLPSLGSSGAIKAVLKGAIDLAAASRPLTEVEREAGAEDTEYARTPFVFAVAAKTQAVQASVDEVADIFAGKRLKWSDDTEIRLVMRPVGDSDSEQIRNMSPRLAEAKRFADKRLGMAFAVSDQDAANDIERIPGAIGTSTLALIVSEKRALRALALDGVQPTLANLASGRYPYFKTLRLILAPNATPTARAFVAFVRSRAAQDILSRAGNLPR